MLKDVHGALSKKLGADAALTQDAAFYLAAALTEQGRPEEASGLLDKLKAAALNSADPGTDWAQRIAGLKGMILQREGKAAQARPLLTAAVASLTQENAPAWVLDPLRAALKATERPTLVGTN